MRLSIELRKLVTAGSGLEYADTIWDNIPEYLSLNIEKILLEAVQILIVTGSKTLLFKETGWVHLSKRR